MLGIQCGTQLHIFSRDSALLFGVSPPTWVEMSTAMTTPNPIRETIDRAVAGDRAAFEQLFEAHADRVEYFVRLRLGEHLRRFVEVEDVLQEAALRACRSIDGFRWRGDGSFLRWLKSIAEHVILENASGGRRLATRLDQDEADTGPSQETLARRDERFERLQAAFDGLSADHREVILLARLRKLPLKTVAEKLSRTESATKQLLWRALQQLRAKFGDTESLRLPHRPLIDRGESDA